MKKITSIALVLISTVTLAQNRSISFEHGTWSEVLAKAGKENKLIFLDAYTSWCGPCKWLAKTVFTNDTVADYFNANFVNAKFDMEKGEGIELAKNFEVQAYPNLLFINSKGEVVHRTCGARPAKDLILFAKEAADPAKQFSAIKARYDKGDRTPAFVLSYLNNVQEACLNTGTIGNEYLDLQKESDLSSRVNWDIMKRHMQGTGSRSFKYLEANTAEFYSKYTRDSVDEVILNQYSGVLYNAIRNKDEATFKATKGKLLNAGYKNAGKMVAGIEIERYAQEGNWNTYADAVINYVEKHLDPENYNALNSFSWEFYEKVDDKAKLAKAEAWAKKAAEGTNEYAIYDTYAAVLFKLGKLKEAESAAVKAIEIGKKDGHDVAGTEELLAKIKGKK